MCSKNHCSSAACSNNCDNNCQHQRLEGDNGTPRGCRGCSMCQNKNSWRRCIIFWTYLLSFFLSAVMVSVWWIKSVKKVKHTNEYEQCDLFRCHIDKEGFQDYWWNDSNRCYGQSMVVASAFGILTALIAFINVIIYVISFVSAKRAAGMHIPLIIGSWLCFICQVICWGVFLGAYRINCRVDANVADRNMQSLDETHDLYVGFAFAIIHTVVISILAFATCFEQDLHSTQRIAEEDDHRNVTNAENKKKALAEA